MLRALGVKLNYSGNGGATLALRLTERRQLLAIVTLALAQGLLFAFIVPPWQHYDEPTHFEYAWLIAQLGRRPLPGDESAVMRREVQASMVADGFFSIQSSLLEAEANRVWIGYSELGHPPGYYALAAVPIALFPHLSVSGQLYLVRLVSVSIFVATIAVTWAIARELTPPNHPLRWAAPLILTLLPTLVDLMTAVNNDVAAVFVVSVFTWGAVRLITRGVMWQTLVWLGLAVAASVLVKNTAMITLAVLPFAGLLALWRARAWRWRWLLLSGAGAGLAASLLLFGWGDPAYWYRSGNWSQQASGIVNRTTQAPHGSHVFVLLSGAEPGQRRIVAPLLNDDIAALVGRRVTVGAWIWADRPASVYSPGLFYKNASTTAFESTSIQPVEVTTTPRFVASTVYIPPAARHVQAVFLVQSDGNQPPQRVYMDSMIVAVGEYSNTATPKLDARAAGGTWGGVPFLNLVRNPSAEQMWPQPRSAAEQYSSRYLRLAPTPTLLALLDGERSWHLLATWSLPTALEGLVERFGWGQVRIKGRGWIAALYGVLFVSTAGGVMWLARARRGATRNKTAAAILVSIVVLAWTITILRPLPLIEAETILPSTRYAFPSIVPSVLLIVGGWLQFWPTRFRRYAVAALVAGVALLNIAGALTLRSFFG